MKNDLTRSTFRRERHYSSVRMALTLFLAGIIHLYKVVRRA